MACLRGVGHNKNPEVVYIYFLVTPWTDILNESDYGLDINKHAAQQHLRGSQSQWHS
jgi:Fe-S cluster assembly ATPase SufC